MRQEIPKRFAIIGLPGSGKSTFAAKLGRLLDIPIYQLRHVLVPTPILIKNICTEKVREEFLDLKELIILRPHKEASIFDHSFNSRTFEGVIVKQTQKYVNNKGE